MDAVAVGKADEFPEFVGIVDEAAVDPDEVVAADVGMFVGIGPLGDVGVVDAGIDVGILEIAAGQFCAGVPLAEEDFQSLSQKPDRQPDLRYWRRSELAYQSKPVARAHWDQKKH